MKALIKSLLPRGRSPRTIVSGPYAGLKLLLDVAGGDGQIWLGLYERETFAHLRSAVRECRTVLDIGAAKGDLTALFHRLPSITHVVAVEPSATELELLRRNLDLNGLGADPRLTLHEGFAGAGPDGRWRTLDQLAAGLPGPFFIKIDIDGPEGELLETGSTLLRGQDCRLLIETHSPEAERKCEAILQGHGYATSIINPAWWRFLAPERRDIPHNRWLVARRPPASA
jgi:precorrin-6B methylase 2